MFPEKSSVVKIGVLFVFLSKMELVGEFCDFLSWSEYLNEFVSDFLQVNLKIGWKCESIKIFNDFESSNYSTTIILHKNPQQKIYNFLHILWYIRPQLPKKIRKMNSASKN